MNRVNKGELRALFVMATCALVSVAQADNRYWVGASAGATANWNTNTSWSTTSGGAGGASVPGPSDAVFFDGAGGFVGGCIIDAAVDVTSITAASLYTGTSGNDGHINATTHDLDVTISGDFTGANKKISMGDGNVWTVGGNWDTTTVSGLVGGTSELRMTGTGKTLTGYRWTLPKVVISGSVSCTVNLEAALDVSGTLTIPGTLSVKGSCRVLTGGRITGPGTLALQYSGGKITQQDGTVDVKAITAHYSVPVVPGTYAVKSFSIDSSFVGGRSWTFAAGIYTFTGDFLITSSGDGNLGFNAKANNPSFVFGGNVAFTQTGEGKPVWTRGSGTITFAGAAAGTQTINLFDFATENIVINDAGATKKFTEGWTAAGFHAIAGTVDFNGQTVATDGNFMIDDTAQVVGSGLDGSAITVGGDLALNGTVGDLLDLVAASDWTLNVAGAAAVDYARVAHSDASAGSTIVCENSKDLGWNQNWFFPVAGTVLLIR